MKSISGNHRRWWIAALALALTVLAACGGGGNSDEDAIRSLLDSELDAVRDADGRALYNLSSPDFRDACTDNEILQDGLDEMVAGIDDPSKLRYEDVEIEVDGDSASATFVVMLDGEPIPDLSTDSTGPSEFEKVDGKWYEYIDPSECPEPAVAEPEDEPTPRPTARATQPAGRTASATPKATPSMAEIQIVVFSGTGVFRPAGSTYGVESYRDLPDGPSFDVHAGEPVRVVLTNADQGTTHTVTVYEDPGFTNPVQGADTGPVLAGESGEFTFTFQDAKTYYFRSEQTVSRSLYAGTIVAK